jgi:hypothetical protein
MAYRNRDGGLSQRNCGLAAAATALRYKERFMGETLAALEERFPPDILFGLCGTSKARVCGILSAYGCHRHEVEGQQALKHALRDRRPVLVMLSLPGHLVAGHWMVTYAYDDGHAALYRASAAPAEKRTRQGSGAVFYWRSEHKGLYSVGRVDSGVGSGEPTFRSRT